MKFGGKLRELRNGAKLTQEELAKKLGVNRNTISNYESGSRYPQDREVFYTLAEIFKVNVNYLFTEDEEFLTVAAERFGPKVQLQAQEILAQTAALFAGGELSDPDRNAFIRDMQYLFLEATEMEQERNTPRKRRK